MRTKRWVSSEDWVKWRTRITELYRENTLKKVMAIMEEEGFYATERMYKSRISAWGLDKNRKEVEMRAIVKKAAKHEESQMTFYVRGKEVPYQSVVQYYRRKPVTIDEVVAERASSRTPTVRYTFPPPPGRSASPTVATLSTPPVIALPEQVLHLVSDYISGSFDGNHWLSGSDDEGAFSFKATDKNTRFALANHWYRLFGLVFRACNQFSKGRSEDGRHSYWLAISGIGELVKAEDPSLIAELPRILLGIIENGKMPEVAILILRQFAEFANLYHGSAHPFLRFCQLLASTDPATLVDVICLAVVTIRDRFIAHLGRIHRTSLSVSRTYFNIVSVRQGRGGEFQEYYDILRDCEIELPAGDRRIVETRANLAVSLLDNGQNEECRAVAKKIIEGTVDRAMSSERGVWVISTCVYGYLCLAHCELRLGNRAEAVAYCQIVDKMLKSLDDEEMSVMTWQTDWLEDLQEELALEPPI